MIEQLYIYDNYMSTEWFFYHYTVIVSVNLCIFEIIFFYTPTDFQKNNINMYNVLMCTVYYNEWTWKWIKYKNIN